MANHQNDNTVLKAEEELHTETTNSDTAHTYPKDCSTLRKNDLVMLHQRPCKILDICSLRIGKHGTGKLHLTGMDLFNDGKKYEDVYPVAGIIDVPYVKYVDYQLINISDDNFLTLLSDNCDIREDLKVPKGDLGNSIRAGFVVGDDLYCTVLNSCGIEGVIGFKLQK